MRKLLLGFWMAMLCMGALAASVAEDLASIVRPDHPDTYVVQEGDTLWDISARFLTEPWMWPELWKVNSGIENPHLIYPGDRIHFAYVEGQPALLLGREGRARDSADGTVRLSPEVRSTPIESAIPAIRMDAIRGFLIDNRIVDSATLAAAPYVLQGESERLVMGAGDVLYARGDLVRGETYSIVRRGAAYVDPYSAELLGIEAIDVGAGRVDVREADIATVVVARSREEVRIGDRLVPTEERDVLSAFYPRAPEQDVEGDIIAVFGGVSQIGAKDLVVINRGEREGLRQGDVLAIKRAGAITRDRILNERVRLPAERAGLLMVVRSFEKLSYGLVLQAERPLAVGDSVANP